MRTFICLGMSATCVCTNVISYTVLRAMADHPAPPPAALLSPVQHIRGPLHRASTSPGVTGHLPADLMSPQEVGDEQSAFAAAASAVNHA